MNPRVVYGSDVPHEIVAAVRSLLAPRLWRLPPWCRTLHVEWDDDADDSAPAGHKGLARAESEVGYRRATLTLYAPWLSATPADREEVIAHELSHFVTQPLSHLFDEALHLIPKEQKALRESMLNRWLETMEGCTTDLAEMMEAERKNG